LGLIGSAAGSFERAAANMAYCLYERQAGDYLGIADDAVEEAGICIEKYRLTLINAEIEGLYEELTIRWKAYREYLKTLRGFVTDGKFDEGLAWRKADGGRTRRACRKTLLKLVDLDIKHAKDVAEENRRTAGGAAAAIWIAIVVAMFAAIGLGFGITRGITVPVRSAVKVLEAMAAGSDDKIRVVEAIAGGDLTRELVVTKPPDVGTAAARKDEIGKLMASISDLASVQMTLEKGLTQLTPALRASRDRERAQDWLKSGVADVNLMVRGDKNLEALANEVLAFLSKHLGAGVSALYLFEEQEAALRIVANYAFTRRKGLNERIRLGEGLAGEAAREKKPICLSQIPPDYLAIGSALGEAQPRAVLAVPLVHDDRLLGVMEFGSLKDFSDLELEFLKHAGEALSVAISVNLSRRKIEELLEQSQRQAEELQAQQEELRAANEELEEQTQRLQQSEEELKAQREELQVTNEELEEKGQALERQNRQVEQARGELAKKAEELATASKSEFLANMSHELRTPPNSLLLLSRSFAENKTGNLTADQVESARVIHQSGSDLLNLINEILDLSKIEAGRMTLQIEDLSVADLAASVRAGFQHLAADKGLALDVAVQPDAPEQITTDRQRVEQIIRNLVSNALKFTEQGSVVVTFGPGLADLSAEALAKADSRLPTADSDNRKSAIGNRQCLSISVADTGIGIAPEHQQAIFEAFQQADGGIARKYGGTGLGLAITRELVKLLGGELRLQSEVGKGSTFTVYLPVQSLPNADSRLPNEGQQNAKDAVPAPAEQSAIGNLKPAIPDDRQAVGEGDRTILIVEDDVRFAEILVKQCREKGFKCVACTRGEEGLELARRYRPNGIILDIRLPGIDGWKVLARLKEDPAVRHIPVHIMSLDEPSLAAMRKGAIGQLRKPVTREGIEEALRKLQEAGQVRVKTVLVAEDDAAMRHSIVELLAARDVKVEEAANGGQALAALRERRYDCLVLDLDLGDMSGGQVLKKLVEEERLPLPPVIVNTARELTPAEVAELSAYSDSIIIKDVRSQERLLDEASLFLHRVVADLPESQRRIIARLHPPEAALQGKKVLVVDDDMRTVFALSRLLGDCGMTVVKAENGEKALSALAAQPDVDLVLTDIMMPVLDGLETMRRIRAQERHAKLPIIALTAKAMKGDREQCLAAGASDYLPKPLDPDRLLSLMRVWLGR
jgi:CheY-like chemotaxis protein